MPLSDGLHLAYMLIGVISSAMDTNALHILHYGSVSACN